MIQAMEGRALTHMDDSRFEYPAARDMLLDQFNLVNLESFGCEDLKEAVSAAGALLGYVQETQKRKIKHIQNINTYRLNDFLWIDDITIRNLELIKNLRFGSRQGTLLGILDRTLTSMGSRLLNQWLCYPQRDLQCIEMRFDAVEEAKDKRQIRHRLMESLKSVSDIERVGGKITMGQCNARDLVSLRNTLDIIPSLRATLSELEAALFQWTENDEALGSLAQLIGNAIREDAPPTLHEGGMIKSGYDETLDKLVSTSRNARDWMAQLEIKEREATGITTLKVRYNKVFGYYIEVPKTRTARVPAHYIRKQTLVNAERYITEELKDFEYKVLNAEQQRAAIEYALF
jgi:DNA mismatch repair protein MutS